MHSKMNYLFICNSNNLNIKGLLHLLLVKVIYVFNSDMICSFTKKCLQFVNSQTIDRHSSIVLTRALP